MTLCECHKNFPNNHQVKYILHKVLFCIKTGKYSVKWKEHIFRRTRILLRVWPHLFATNDPFVSPFFKLNM